MKLTFDVPDDIANGIETAVNTIVEEYKSILIWPSNGEDYYCINGDGTIHWNIYNDGSNYCKGALQLGNCFKTREEAEFKLEKLKVFQELEQLADDDQPLDKDGGYSHVCIQYDWKYNKCHPTPNFRYATYSPFHFKSVESCQAAIDKIGEERLKKYYFQVSEEEK